MAVRTRGSALPGRPGLFAPTIAVVLLLVVLGGVFVSIYTDLLWFRETGFSDVFGKVLRTKALLFALFGLLMAVVVGANIAIAYRSRPPFRPLSLEQQNLERYRVAIEPYLVWVLLLVSTVFGIFAGLSAASRWETWLLWRNGVGFGETDAQFGKDISYFAFTYPFQRWLLGFALAVVVLSLIASAVTHYLFGGVRLQTQGEKVSLAARAHLSVLFGVVLLLKAVGYYLDRFGLAFSLRGVVQGPSYTDVNAVLPAKTMLVFIAIICALLCFANIVVRNVLLPGGAVALLVVSAVLVGGIYPAYTQQFRVRPNEVEREAKYITRNIEATRAAYGIDGVVVDQYAATKTSTAAEIRADKGTVPNARLLDPNLLGPAFRREQQIRNYFDFADSLDIDRYTVDGQTKDYIVAVRELDQSNLGDDQRNWINTHLTYTHGNGFVAAAANAPVDGLPSFTVKDLPVSSPGGELAVDQPRIYYGEKSPDYSIVATKQKEVDGPGTGKDDQATFSYDGAGGVKLDSGLNKLLYALKFREKNILLSSSLTSDSKLMYIRQPKERVAKVAPFLQLDSDPYPALVDGRVLWIVDGYTTSKGYPYSQRTTLGEAVIDSRTGRPLEDQEVNYIRNSVKATVDAYSGKVTLYAWDEKDPVLRTWRKAFPDAVQPRASMSAALIKHVRYPEDLFKVQRELLSQYHVTDPRVFFNKEDFWAVPGDPTKDTEVALTTGASPAPGSAPRQDDNAGIPQPPYYALLQYPGRNEPAFSLTTAFVARRTTNLTAFAAVSSDPSDYGVIRILQLPKNTNVSGPGQVANQFETSQVVSNRLLPLRNSGSKVVLGNLLTLPVGNGLLYVQPVYAQSKGTTSYPIFNSVIVSFGDKIALQPTLAEALNELFGVGTAAPGATPSPGASPGTPGAGTTLSSAIAAANKAFTDGQAALMSGDFAEYGRQQAALQAALADLARLQGVTTSPTPSASASPSPSASR